MVKVFLGGTCNESIWRNELMPLLEDEGIEYFNPVVEDWTPECQEEEERQKEICGIHLFLITKKMKGVFSIAEAVASCQNKNKATLFGFADFDGEFDTAEKKSLDATGRLIAKLGGNYLVGLTSIRDLAARIATLAERFLSFEVMNKALCGNYEAYSDVLTPIEREIIDGKNKLELFKCVDKVKRYTFSNHKESTDFLTINEFLEHDFYTDEGEYEAYLSDGEYFIGVDMHWFDEEECKEFINKTKHLFGENKTLCIYFVDYPEDK